MKEQNISKNPLFRKSMVPLMIGGTMLLASCAPVDNSSSSVKVSVPTVYKMNLEDCKTMKPDQKGVCVENSLKKLQDTWIRNCAVSNISESTRISKNMKDNKVTDNDIKDVANVVKECTYYKEKNKEQVKTNNSSYPVFGSFLNSVAGTYVGMALYDSMFNNYYNSDSRRNCQYNTSKCDNGYSGYVATHGSTVSNTANSDTKTNKAPSKLDSIKNVDTKAQKDAWQVNKMKSASSLNNSNYKLGDTSTRWTNVSTKAAQDKLKSRSSSKSSWSSSSKSSTRSSSTRSSGRSSGFGG